MSFGRYLPQRLKRVLLPRARSFVLREEGRALLNELSPGGEWGDLVSGSQVPLLRSLASIRACLRSVPDVLVDVGAHLGHFSRAAVECVGFEQVVCFEPDSDLGGELQENLKRVPCVVHNVALSSRCGTTEMFVHPVKAMNSLRESDPEIIKTKFQYDPYKITKRSVEVATLDSVLFSDDQYKGLRFFLKIDTQGNEYEVLQGARKTLEQSEGCLIEFMFCSPYAKTEGFRELIQFMSESGFDCCGPLNVMRRSSHEVSGVDFLFVRQQP